MKNYYAKLLIINTRAMHIAARLDPFLDAQTCDSLDNDPLKIAEQEYNRGLLNYLIAKCQ